ncbi:MAG TPA: Sir2 family NAD-dependent protein deacetylase [Acidobacteriaceae bacterium]|nr:Sir2 family NAD-dependent protein deacetylase [Acidobacteriaceae bacterium]
MGAGISPESGLATFRGSGRLWNGHRVEEVATPEARRANPELLRRFYSMRLRRWLPGLVS